MKKIINSANVVGYLYEHNLEMRQSGPDSKNPGMEYIRGTVSIASEDLTNVVKVNYTYVAPTFGSGKENTSFTFLNKVINGQIPTVMSDGIEKAAKVRVDSALNLGEWYDKNDWHLISTIRNEGGFIHQIQGGDAFAPAATFDTDIVITNVRRVEANEERNIPEKVILKGGIFDFRGALKPVEFSVVNPKAMDYFENQDISSKNPMFTHVKGEQISRTIVRKIEEESAWGEISIREVKNSQKDFVVTWAASVPYEWDSEEGILASEFSEKISQREIYLAELKTRQEEYQNSKNNAFANIAATASNSNGGYDF